VSRTALATLLGGLVLGLLLAGPAAAAPVKLTGTVGPGHTIQLRQNGKQVRRLEAGVAYRMVVSDRADDHDFRIVGPGLSRAITAVEFMGTRAVVVKFRPGAFRFFCVPHADEMRGSFRVVR
jgi:hypothetical protein